jgi:phosphatidylserine/phosphatidylglycerophosphate/cardiolipin synthase-like enzyme
MDPTKLENARALATQFLATSVAATAGLDASRRPQLKLPSVFRVNAFDVAVSPDGGYPLVRDAISSAQREICLYIYNATAPHLLNLLTAARDRGVKVKVMYDVMDTRGGERDKLAGLGVDLQLAPSTGGRRVFTVCHQKFAVIDDKTLLIGSANWAGTSIPLLNNPNDYRKGNREWLARLDHPGLAAWYKQLFLADWNIPEEPVRALEPEVSPTASLLAPAVANKPDQIFPPRDFQEKRAVHVTPVVSPDNYYDVVRGLILGAQKSIDIEQQYIIGGGPKAEGLLAALEQMKDKVQIRIIVSPAFRVEGEVDNWELSCKTLDAFGLKDCLRAMDLRFITHLHNKGVIIDRETVLVSSTNWSENSISRAREAGVAIKAPDIAEYYAKVFDFDWASGQPADQVRAVMMLDEDELTGEMIEIDPADLAIV